MPVESSHREAVGALPLLQLATPRQQQGHQDELTQTFLRSNLIYFGDFWNYSGLKWCSEDAVLHMLEPIEQHYHVPTNARLRRRYRHLTRSFTRQYPQAVANLKIQRELVNPPDGPSVGEIWADPTTSPITIGRVVEVDPTRTGPVNHGEDDRDACSSKPPCVTAKADTPLTSNC